MFSPVHAPVAESYEPELGVKVGDIAGVAVSARVKLLTGAGPLFVTVIV